VERVAAHRWRDDSGRFSKRSCITEVRLGTRHRIEKGQRKLGTVYHRKGQFGGSAVAMWRCSSDHSVELRFDEQL
jgi:hypothetical protein